MKQNFNSVKDRQLHAMHNRFGEQQDERPQWSKTQKNYQNIPNENLPKANVREF